MGNFVAVVDADLRRAVLDLLMQTDGYDLNENILRSALSEFGHRPSRDKLRTQLDWLVEQNLLTTRTVGGIIIARLTDRGLDVAENRVSVPGVKRPLPGDYRQDVQ